MKDFSPIILYKCPGAYKSPDNVLYKEKGCGSQSEFDELLADGWFDSLEKAATDCGPSCLWKKRTKRVRGDNKYKLGLPYVAPVKVEAVSVEDVSEEKPICTEEAAQEPEKPPESKSKPKLTKLSDMDKEIIVGLLKEGDSNSKIAKQYGVTPQAISLIKKKNGL